MTEANNQPETNNNQFYQTLLHIANRAVEARLVTSLSFIMVNETIQATPYRQAAYFDLSLNDKPKLAAASGLVSAEENSPYTVWVNDFARDFNADKSYQLLDFANSTAKHREFWQEWLPDQLIVIPLKDFSNTLLGYNLFAKETPWTEQEIGILLHLHKTYAYCLSTLHKETGRWKKWLSAVFSRKGIVIGSAALGLLMLIPVRLSALAPAEIIALNAFSVASPQDGVIANFNVEPNVKVKKGDLLFSLDNTSISNRVEVATKGLEIAKSDALVAEQRAFDDLKGKSELANAIGRMREKEAELASIETLRARVEVRAERDGIAVFVDANDWIGRPVQTGERVMQIADPSDAGLLVWLPAQDALNIEAGAPIKLFLHTQPLDPIAATLRQTSYQALQSPDNVMSYRLKGSFNNVNQLPRIGLRGTARISGGWSILGYYLFRRPIAAARAWTGL